MVSVGHASGGSVPTVRRRAFHSNTTSPDSGASLSPGVESVELGRHYLHSNPQSNSHSGHHGQVPGAQYGTEYGRVFDKSVEGAKFRGKSNPPYFSGGQGNLASPHLLKPHSSAPLVLHPPPMSHAPQHAPQHAPPPQHYPAAFSPTRPNFVKTWSQSVNNLAQQQQQQQQQQQWSTQKPLPPATPLTATPHSLTASTFTLPEAYREAAVPGHAYPQQSRPRPDYQRSMTLPHGHSHAHPASRPTLRTQYASLSQDDLLDRPSKSAFHVPSNPQYSTFLKHYPDNLEVTQPTSKQRGDDGRAPGNPGGSHGNAPHGNASMQGLPAQPKTAEMERDCETDQTYVYDKLSSVDMLDLLLNISAQHCQIRKLEYVGQF